jgi:hypothetical protein
MVGVEGGQGIATQGASGSEDLAPADPPGPDRARRPPAPLLPGATAALVVGALAARLAQQMWRLTPGHLTYDVDDSHIHLRVAELLSHGTYGINPGHGASPSSSPIWPFLLAPFGRLGSLPAVPLAINVACVVATTVVVYRIIWVGWGGLRWTSHAWFGWLAAGAACWVVVASGALALPFTGMEHSLHVLVTVAVALGLLLLGTSPGRRAPAWLWACIALLPLIRYEGLLGLVVAVAIAALLGAARPALRAAAVGLGALVAFSAFLLALGLPPLPSSVLAKAGESTDLGLVGGIEEHLRQAARASGNGLTPMLCALVLGLASLCLVGLNGRRSSRDVATLLTLGSTTVLLGQITIGEPSRRYVGYAVALAMTVAVGVAAPAIIRRGRLWASIPAVAAVAALCLFGMTVYRGVAQGAPARARSIYDQQYQMHRFAADLGEAVLVNDLGNVAYDSDVTVLDGVGLGDDEARRLRRDGGPNWLADLMERRGVSVALIYEDWFEGQIPASWTRVGTLTNPVAGAPAEQVVSVFATDDDAAARARAALEQFEPSDPERTVVDVEPT